MLYAIILIIVYLFYINRPKSPNGVILYFANVGSGKTTLLSRYAQKELKKIAKGKSKFTSIVSNSQISGVTYIEDIRGMLKKGAFQNTLLLIDEASIIYNNRKLNMTETEIQFFKLIRHYKCACVVVSQSYNDIDVTLRRLYTQIYLLNYMPLYTLIRPIKKVVGIDEMTHDIVDMYKFKNIFSWRLLARPVYFKFFNSWWIPSDVKIHDVSSYEKIPYQIKSKHPRIMKEEDLIKLQQEEEIPDCIE